MRQQNKQPADRSWSLFWTPFAPISEVTEANREAVAKWLEDRSSLLVWLTSVITGALALITLFGKKLGFETPGQRFLSMGTLLLFAAVLMNVICVWQIPKWSYAVKTGLISKARPMVLELELSSWLSLALFLSGLVMIVIGST